MQEIQRDRDQIQPQDSMEKTFLKQQKKLANEIGVCVVKIRRDDSDNLGWLTIPMKQKSLVINTSSIRVSHGFQIKAKYLTSDLL